MGKLLSIIIPTYNMEAYLPRCLDSLLESTEILGVLEVIVVNDGSKDSSSKIAHEYHAKYPNTIIVIDKENGNYGSCVNKGLKVATGDFVKVVDSDDWVETNELGVLVKELKDCVSDMVITPYQKVYDNSLKVEECSLPQKFQRGVWCVDDIFQGKEFLLLPMHMLAYRTDVLRSINYVQTEGVSYTDSEWVFKPLFHIQTVKFINANVYRYLLGREGQTMDPKVVIKSLNQELKVLHSQLSYRIKYYSKVKFSNVRKYVDFVICRKCILIYTQMLLKASNSEFDAEIVNRMESMLKALAPELYDRMAYFDARCVVVRYWRMKGRRMPSIVRSFLSFCLKFVKFFKSL